MTTAAAGLDRDRLLRWIVAWTGLSATWHLGDTPHAPQGADAAPAGMEPTAAPPTAPPSAVGEVAAAAMLAVGQAAEALLTTRPR